MLQPREITEGEVLDHLAKNKERFTQNYLALFPEKADMEDWEHYDIECFRLAQEELEREEQQLTDDLLREQAE